MKLSLIAILVTATLSSTIEKHYHYHFDGISAESQRALLQRNPSHKGFFSRVWCRVSNWKKANVDACNAKYEAKDANNNQNTVVVQPLSSPEVLVKKHLIQIFEHKLNWKQSKCWSLYFWSKVRREKCLAVAQTKLASEIKGLNVPQKHRALWGSTKCFTRFMFNKAKRLACYAEVKANDIAKKNKKIAAK